MTLVCFLILLHLASSKPSQNQRRNLRQRKLSNKIERCLRKSACRDRIARRRGEEWKRRYANIFWWRTYFSPVFSVIFALNYFQLLQKKSLFFAFFTFRVASLFLAKILFASLSLFNFGRDLYACLTFYLDLGQRKTQSRKFSNLRRKCMRKCIYTV